MGTISVQKFKESIVGQVAAHSIYVWGASGQLCKDIDESWIRQKEARNENGAHADDAVAAWKSVMAGPYRDVARAFDCSGFVSWCLIRCGALSGRKDCDGLTALSKSRSIRRTGKNTVGSKRSLRAIQSRRLLWPHSKFGFATEP